MSFHRTKCCCGTCQPCPETAPPISCSNPTENWGGGPWPPICMCDKTTEIGCPCCREYNFSFNIGTYTPYTFCNPVTGNCDEMINAGLYTPIANTNPRMYSKIEDFPSIPPVTANVTVNALNGGSWWQDDPYGIWLQCPGHIPDNPNECFPSIGVTVESSVDFDADGNIDPYGCSYADEIIVSNWGICDPSGAAPTGTPYRKAVYIDASINCGYLIIRVTFRIIRRIMIPGQGGGGYGGGPIGSFGGTTTSIILVYIKNNDEPSNCILDGVYNLNLAYGGASGSEYCLQSYATATNIIAWDESNYGQEYNCGQPDTVSCPHTSCYPYFGTGSVYCNPAAPYGHVACDLEASERQIVDLLRSQNVFPETITVV